MNGATLYAQLKQARDAAKAQRDAQSAVLVSLNEHITAQRAQQEHMTLRFAQVVLGALDQDVKAPELAALEAKVGQKVQQRHINRAANQALLAQTEQTIKANQPKHDEATRAAQVAQAALDAYTALHVDDLRAQGEHQARLQALHDSEQVAERALRKAEQSDQDALAKLPAYQNDPLFSYLLTRGYTANSVYPKTWAGRLDHWVAGLCGYARHQPDFVRLQEVPRQMRAHAERMKAVAAQARADIQASEAACLIRPEAQHLSDALAQANALRDAVRQRLQDAEQTRRTLQDRERAFLTGADEAGQQIATILTAQLRDLSTRQRADLAQATSSTDDDGLPEQIEGLNLTLAQDQQAAQQQAEQLHQAEQQLDRADAACRAFRTKGWDGAHSRFRTADWDSQAVLQGFILGQMSQADLFERLARYHSVDTPVSAPAPSSSPMNTGDGFGGDSSMSVSGGGFGGDSFNSGGGF